MPPALGLGQENSPPRCEKLLTFDRRIRVSALRPRTRRKSAKSCGIHLRRLPLLHVGAQTEDIGAVCSGQRILPQTPRFHQLQSKHLQTNQRFTVCADYTGRPKYLRTLCGQFPCRRPAFRKLLRPRVPTPSTRSPPTGRRSLFPRRLRLSLPPCALRSWGVGATAAVSNDPVRQVIAYSRAERARSPLPCSQRAAAKPLAHAARNKPKKNCGSATPSPSFYQFDFLADFHLSAIPAPPKPPHELEDPPRIPKALVREPLIARGRHVEQ